MQRSLHTETWRVYALALLNVLLTSDYFVHSCEPFGLECGQVAPTNKTNIVDLTSSGCNDTHIWISWSWTTPMGCAIDKVAINGGYTCFMEDGSQFHQPYRGRHLRPSWGITDWSYSHSAWNASSSPTPLAECYINGFFEISGPCKQKLLPVNITCSNPVQPTSTSYPPMMTSSSLAPIAVTTAYTLSQETTFTSTIYSTLTIPPTPTTTPELNISFQETQKIIVITAGLIVALLLVTIFVAVMLKRWKNQKPINYYTNYYDKDLLDFKPGFIPVIPDEVIFKDDAVSIKSIIAPLEKIESTLVLTDISTATTQKLSQPKDYRQLG